MGELAICKTTRISMMHERHLVATNTPCPLCLFAFSCSICSYFLYHFPHAINRWSFIDAMIITLWNSQSLSCCLIFRVFRWNKCWCQSCFENGKIKWKTEREKLKNGEKHVQKERTSGNEHSLSTRMKEDEREKNAPRLSEM